MGSRLGSRATARAQPRCSGTALVPTIQTRSWGGSEGGDPRLENLPCEERLKKFSPLSWRGSGDPIRAPQDTQGRSAEDGGSLCRRSPMGRAVGEGHKLHQEVSSQHDRNFQRQEQSWMEQPSQGRAPMAAGSTCRCSG